VWLAVPSMSESDIAAGKPTPVTLHVYNGVSGAGAVFDFTPLVAGGSLPPDAQSDVKTLTFRLYDLRPPRTMTIERMRESLVSLDARVLGKSMGTSATEVR
jgi:hypothetical protein